MSGSATGDGRAPIDRTEHPEPDSAAASRIGTDVSDLVDRAPQAEHGHIARAGLAPADRSTKAVDDRERALDRIVDRLSLDRPGARDAVGQAYDVTREYIAPFVVAVTNKILEDVKEDVARNPDAKVLFVGRDGHSMAVAAHRLEPELFERHCTEAVVSRAIGESAVQDLEMNAGRSFPELADFRRAGEKIDPADVAGAKQRLTAHLQDAGVPVGEPDSEVILVDTSFKGTVQELLSAVYPQTSFQGRYAFFGESPHDPHPGSKKGYAVHFEASAGSDGRPVSHLPAEEGLTFANQDAIAAVEDTLHGAWSSPRRLDERGPQQHPLRESYQPLDGLNPIRVADAYTHPDVREAVMDANIVAVADHADRIGEVKALGADWRGELDAGEERGRAQVRAWVGGEGGDPRFAEVMDSFARRVDKEEIRQLAKHIDDAGVPHDQAVSIWREYDQLESWQERREFVAVRTARPSGGMEV